MSDKGLVKLCYEVLDGLKARGINYPDPLFVKMQTIKGSLQSIESHFKFEEKGD